MSKVILNKFDRNCVNDPDTDLLRRIVFGPDYWGGRTSDTAILDFEDSESSRTLIICYHVDYGFYLHFHQGLNADWVSVGDDHRLREIVEHCGDGDGPVSVGLFLPPQQAWRAVDEFCRTGNRSSLVRWSDLSDMPDEARW